MNESRTLESVAADFWAPPPELVSQLPRGGIHLDYVGHADVNRTLTLIDAGWCWEPLAFEPDGLPRIVTRNKMAVLWGRLTLLGKTVLCVGSCPADKADVDKELVGDLIRNGAMRHNVYGALWSKAERAGVAEHPVPWQRQQRRRGAPDATVAEIKLITDVFDGMPDEERRLRKQEFAAKFGKPDELTRDQVPEALAYMGLEPWKEAET